MFIIGDHLGSTSIVTDDEGAVISETKYTAWGEVRYSSSDSPTNYTYTGQYSYVSDFGLHFYNARWYDSSLGRFAQADTIIPTGQGVQAYDRYAYTNNNPIRYTDPSGHDAWWATSPQQAQNYYDSIVTPSNPAPVATPNPVSTPTPSLTLNQFETELTSYVTNTGRYYGVKKEKEAEVSFHVTTVNSYIFKYANDYKNQTGFSWRPETLAYFYATLIVESQFGTAMIGDMTETGDQYYARGYIHLTGEDNYRQMGENYGVNLIGNPDLASSNLELSARIAMRCMVVGACTGAKLDDYYYGNGYDFVGARDIVNPGSKSAQETALMAQDILPIVQKYWNTFGLP
jgi:RHS repeat-associated protein